MSDTDGTYSRLAKMAQTKTGTAPREAPPPSTLANGDRPDELSTTPYINMSYRFTEDEIRWLRRQAFDLTEALGSKVTQNAVLRVAIRLLRKACAKNPTDNPLTDAFPLLKK